LGLHRQYPPLGSLRSGEQALAKDSVANRELAHLDVDHFMKESAQSGKLLVLDCKKADNELSALSGI
jgi:hypothetical protein